MSKDISDAVLDGDPYEEASALTRRVFPVSLTRKIRLCSAVLLATAAFAPAIEYRGELIRTLEPAAAVSTPALGSVVALGAAITFLFGLALVRHRRLLDTRDFDVQAAKQHIRFEDLLMAFVVSTGFLFVLVPLSLVVLGAASSEAIVWLYELDIRLYRPSAPGPLTARTVSGGGLLLALALAAVEMTTR
ncbi:hypothetical protein [Natronomonas sp.]|uniref:hypothetical protein n=1 Tax=Natronomonas sp. TaxID=2184060 RepID=UPI00262A3441|nr:hypothetical protein [Natronomonas sp.]